MRRREIRIEPVISATWKAEVKDLNSQDLFGLQNEFKASPYNLVRPSINMKSIKMFPGYWSVVGYLRRMR